MGLTVEDAQFVADCRRKMINNMAEGKAPEAGIDKELLKTAYEKIRKDRSLGAAASGKPARAKKAEVQPIDLNEWLKK